MDLSRYHRRPPRLPGNVRVVRSRARCPTCSPPGTELGISRHSPSKQANGVWLGIRQRQVTDTLFCRNEYCVRRYIYSRPGILTHAFSILPTITAAFFIILVGNQIAEFVLKECQVEVSRMTPISVLSVQQRLGAPPGSATVCLVLEPGVSCQPCIISTRHLYGDVGLRTGRGPAVAAPGRKGQLWTAGPELITRRP
jgi:hypothetical protein